VSLVLLGRGNTFASSMNTKGNDGKGKLIHDGLIKHDMGDSEWFGTLLIQGTVF
jgi:hypothetical protein